MAYTYQQILEAQAERIASAQAAAASDLEAARHREDADGVMYSANEVLRLDAERAALMQRASQFANQQAAAPQRHPSGLSAEEIEVAKASHSAGTPEQRIQEYAANKQRLQHLRATGQYRDDQGLVRR